MFSLGLFIFLISCPAFSIAPFFEQAPIGWHWNNRRVLPKKKHFKPLLPKENSVEAMKAIHVALLHAKDRAVLDPTVQHIRVYLTLQKAITDQSTRFVMNWQKTLLLYPALDEGLQHPTTSFARQIDNSEKNSLKIKTAKRLAQHAGLLYFYRGENSLAQGMATTVAQFAKTYGFALMGVTMDNHVIPSLPENKGDSGQAEKLGVKALPAIVLVNPTTGDHKLIAYGYLSEEDLLTACFNAATNFKQLI